MTNCEICGRELTNEKSVIRGIGPICRNKIFERIQNHPRRVCDYRVEWLEEEKIIIIHELVDIKNPKVSLTNCIEYVIEEICLRNGICASDYTIIQHTGRGDLFGEYEDYDLVDISGESVLWKYLWHADASLEKEKSFSRQLLIDRVKSLKVAAV